MVMNGTPSWDKDDDSKYDNSTRMMILTPLEYNEDDHSTIEIKRDDERRR
jgi:hypothetical protein